jgi:hypothetical protein
LIQESKKNIGHKDCDIGDLVKLIDAEELAWRDYLESGSVCEEDFILRKKIKAIL